MSENIDTQKTAEIVSKVFKNNDSEINDDEIKVTTSTGQHVNSVVFKDNQTPEEQSKQEYYATATDEKQKNFFDFFLEAIKKFFDMFTGQNLSQNLGFNNGSSYSSNIPNVKYGATYPNELYPEYDDYFNRIEKECGVKISQEERAAIMAIIDRESRFNPGAKNPNSSALGLSQMLKGTRERLCQLHPNMPLDLNKYENGDKYEQLKFTALLVKQVEKEMGVYGGDPRNINLGWFLGSPTTKKLLNVAAQHPYAKITDFFPVNGDVFKHHKSMFTKSDGSVMTIKEFLDSYNGKFDARSVFFMAKLDEVNNPIDINNEVKVAEAEQQIKQKEDKEKKEKEQAKQEKVAETEQPKSEEVAPTIA